MAGTWGLETLNWKISIHGMYYRAQEKLRHSGYLEWKPISVISDSLHCKGNAYHLTGGFFLREAMQKDFQVKRWQAAAAELCALIKWTSP